MKKLVLIFLFISTLSIAQQYGWIDLSDNIPDSNYIQKGLRDMYFIGQEGWIGGTYNSEARIYHTTDGGQTFDSQPLPPYPYGSQTVMSIHMRSNLEGYAVTNQGKIFRTKDGGVNWKVISSVGGSLLYSVTFPPLPDSAGYACGSYGKVLKIQDTTVTIELTGAQTLYSIIFPENSKEGWVCGGPTVRHRDSTGWKTDQKYDNGNWYNSVNFVTNRHGWMVGLGLGPDHDVTSYTKNGFDWLCFSRNEFNGLNDVFFIDTLEGWTVGGHAVLHSTDGGITWNKDSASIFDTTIFLYYIFPVNNHEIYVTGKQSFGPGNQRTVLFKYTDITGIEATRQTPSKYILEQNYPNPFNPTTKIRYTIPSNVKGQMSNIVLKIYDVLGQDIQTLVNEKQSPGEYEVEFNADGLPSGVYFYKLNANGNQIIKKMLFVK